MVFEEQRRQGTLAVWAEPFTVLRIPKLYNLRTDPFERADITSNTYWDWYMSKAYMIMAAQSIVTQFVETFQEFPRQKAASFTIDQILEKMAAAVEMKYQEEDGHTGLRTKAMTPPPSERPRARKREEPAGAPSRH